MTAVPPRQDDGVVPAAVHHHRDVEIRLHPR